MAFPQKWIGELLARNDIVDVVGEYVQLKRKSGRMWGLCPFHAERTPSFSVAEDKQLYYCFGCHAGGGVINFVMEMEKLSYLDAVRMLANRVGMSMPEEVDDQAIMQERKLKDRLLAALTDAARYFHANLLSDKGGIARDYLERRGVEQRTAIAFGLGYSLPGWENMTGELLKKGYTEDELVTAGLAIKSKDGGRVYDAFRGRVMFPIIGLYSKVIGFGARALGDEKPKYLNSNETPVFNKRANLYGINLLRGKKPESLVLVEGYMDVVSLYGHGVEGAVASLGTALTQQQARLMKRYASTVHIAYDGDSAGQNATIRGLDILAKEELSVRVIQLPRDMDPDDFVKAKGKEGFEGLKQAAMGLNAFKLRRLGLAHDLMTEDGREAFALEGAAFISTLPPVEAERQIGELARMTGFSIDAVKAQCGQSVRTQRNRLANYRNTRKKAALSPERATTERILVKLALTDGAWAAEGKKLEGDLSQTCAQTLEAIEQCQGQSLAVLLAVLTAEQAELAVSSNELPQPEDQEQTFKEALRSVKRLVIEEKLDQLTADCEDQTQPPEIRAQWLREIRELNVKLDRI